MPRRRIVRRPWGSYEVVKKGDQFAIKELVVKPGEALSLQTHWHREEHWVVVRGAAEVQLIDSCDPGEEVTRYHLEGDYIHVPQNVAHRLSNPGRIDLHVVEVQLGLYLEEDDEIRLEDKYGREEK